MYIKAGFGIKKVIVISSLLLANTIMLVHGVVCHHHQHGIWAIVCHEHYYNLPDHHHDDDQPVGHCNDPYCHGDIDDCTLTTFYVKLNNDKFQSFGFDFDLLPCSLPLSLDDFTPQIANDIGLPFRQNPYLLSYHTEYISHSLGLRAPPFEL